VLHPLVTAISKDQVVLYQRLAIDPNKNSILYFGARSGNGLWKSTNYGKTWKKVTSFTSVGNSSMRFENLQSDMHFRHIYSRSERRLRT